MAAVGALQPNVKCASRRARRRTSVDDASGTVIARLNKEHSCTQIAFSVV